jgi:hypothetical protein
MSLSGLSYAYKERVHKALKGSVLDRYWLSPWKVLDTPDPWQKDALFHLITLRENTLMLCSRKGGKSFCVGAACYLEMLMGGFALVLSRSDRQAMLVMEYVKAFERKHRLVAPSRPPTAHEIRLVNGGRSLAVPCREDTIRGIHNVTLLVIDEAARIPDDFYGAVTPMLDVLNDGRLCLLSTPFGERGFFWNEWTGNGRQNWVRHKYPWTSCSRLTPEFIEEERQSHGDDWVRQEYELKFMSTTANFFDMAAMEKLCTSDFQEYV